MKQNLIIGCDINLLFSDTSTQTDKNDNYDNYDTCRFNLLKAVKGPLKRQVS